jgi:hypothetical protein
MANINQQATFQAALAQFGFSMNTTAAIVANGITSTQDLIGLTLDKLKTS